MSSLQNTDAIRSALEAAREALRLLLATPEIADAHPADKDEETHVAERDARASLAKIDAALASLDAPQPDALREAENAVSHAFGLLSSAVRCGEAWRQELDDAKDRARAALARLKGEGAKPAIDTGARRELLARAIEALEALLACPEIADCDPRDKDPETHVAERKARAALARLKGEGAKPAPDVEKVAGALFRAQMISTRSWEETDEDIRESYRVNARAAIAAMEG